MVYIVAMHSSFSMHSKTQSSAESTTVSGPKFPPKQLQYSCAYNEVSESLKKEHPVSKHAVKNAEYFKCEILHNVCRQNDTC